MKPIKLKDLYGSREDKQCYMGPNKQGNRIEYKYTGDENAEMDEWRKQFNKLKHNQESVRVCRESLIKLGQVRLELIRVDDTKVML